jgi:eukaryotic-like serine/threonine-protein kinase
MQPDERLQFLFDSALELDPVARMAFLVRECGNDHALLEELQSLLASDAAAEQNPGWDSSAIETEGRQHAGRPDEHLGETIGPYQIVAVIGRGGMGKVYRAVRSDSEYRQSVALKLIHGGDDAEEIVNRFRLERQILADLDHPNIARLLDGGTTASGLPYLVMEYIDGEPLDAWCTKHQPSLAVRLRVFRAVCSAVHDAHRHMVIHRDLKPANILVTQDGTPKLLDFGISKLLESSAQEPSATVTGFRMMTPRYASPEQVRGEVVTAASDIFSLGVVLYELLTGHSPYATPDGPLHEVTRSVCEEEPRKPGTISAQLRGDLDSIILMALRKDPKRRYSSVDQFAEDIRRYQEGYPIVARPDTRGYRVRKFVGRNKTSAMAAVLVVLALLGGIAATSWQAHLANRRFEEVRSLANSYLFEFHDAIKDLPGAMPARQLVVKRALEFLGRLSEDRGNDPQLAHELAAAYARISAIQGGGQMSLANLGDQAGAVASSLKAVAILERLAAADPQNLGIGLELAQIYGDLSYLRRSLGDLAASVQNQRKAIALLERFLAAAPENPKLRKALVVAYSILGDVLGNHNTPNLGDPKASLVLYRKALAIQEKLAAGDPGNLDQQRLLGLCWTRLAQILESLGDKPGGRAAHRRALEVFERVLLADPSNTDYQWDAAAGNGNLTLSLLRVNQLDEARITGARSLLLYGQLATADPKNANARLGLGDAYAIQGRIHEKANASGLALRSYGQSVATFETLAAEHPGALLPLGQRNVYSLVAELTLNTGDVPKAIKYAEKALAIDDRYLKANPRNATAQRNQATANRQIGRAHELLGSRKTMPLDQRRIELREACVRYRRGYDALLLLQKAGTLIPAYAIELDVISRYLANCEKSLAALN